MVRNCFSTTEVSKGNDCKAFCNDRTAPPADLPITGCAGDIPSNSRSGIYEPTFRSASAETDDTASKLWFWAKKGFDLDDGHQAAGFRIAVLKPRS